jgi:ribonuclease J
MASVGRPGSDELLFLPLGGAGEIGMNLNLYGHAGKWLMVDLGVTFGDEATPGIEVIMPDPRFIEERREDLVGIVLTHAHEDHLGAVPYLWERLGCPVWATPFTAAVLRRKLHETGLAGRVPILEVPLSGRFQAGPFEIELVTLTHSIPEPNALVIRTGAGTVLHSGDWKFDPEPLVGAPSDIEALRRLGEQNILALVCDSTNALVAGHSGSEAEVREELIRLFGRFHNRIAVACFASNVARLESVVHAALAHDRHVALVGRSMRRIVEAAQETGYLTGLPPFVSEHDAGYLPREKVALLCTGSQGEPRSALARIARNDHPQVTLEPGDAVIFSSRVIPGNEKAIGALQNDLARLDVEIVTAEDEPVHVSGHPAREELARMYQLVRPRIAIPVHGERRHLEAHARLAEECQVPQAIAAENGRMIRLAPGPAEVAGEVEFGRLGLDGSALVPLGGALIKHRHRISASGSAVATLVMARDGRLLADPQVTLHGLVDPEADGAALGSAAAAVRSAIEALNAGQLADDAAVKEAARLAVRRYIHAERGKKPLTDVHLVRV